MEPAQTVPVWLKFAVYLMFTLCIGMGAFLVLGILERRRHFTGIERRLAAAGYETVESQTDLTVTNPPQRPTRYNAPCVKLLNGADASVAMFCATGEITGTVRGDLLFVGIPLSHPTLVIHPGAVLASNVETTCWMVKNFGEIRGQLLGTRNFYLTNQNATAASPR